MNKPIKRSKPLQPFSHDHHQGLLFCWKIQEGLKRDVAPERMKRYADWFWKNHLIPHFEVEEKFIFPVLGNNHEWVIKALSQHRSLEKLFEYDWALTQTLQLITKELNDHIRFEERILFNEIEKAASPEQLAEMEIHHQNTEACEQWKDAFWK